MHYGHHGVILFRTRPLHATPCSDTPTDHHTGPFFWRCYDWGLWTQNLSKQNRKMTKSAEQPLPAPSRTAGARAPAWYSFRLGDPDRNRNPLRLLLKFHGVRGCANYLPNSHQISSLLAANTKKLASRHNLKETYIKKMNVDWASWLAYTCTRLWIQTSTAN